MIPVSSPLWNISTPQDRSQLPGNVVFDYRKQVHLLILFKLHGYRIFLVKIHMVNGLLLHRYRFCPSFFFTSSQEALFRSKGGVDDFTLGQFLSLVVVAAADSA
ncbi:hypothetical protein L1887_28894 [Cichorium endivia]|nr:hypothetical protein L1887_28894 [Cichorium endivia]